MMSQHGLFPSLSTNNLLRLLIFILSISKYTLGQLTPDNNTNDPIPPANDTNIEPPLEDTPLDETNQLPTWQIGLYVSVGLALCGLLMQLPALRHQFCKKEDDAHRSGYRVS